jgi:hypothetical protein
LETGNKWEELCIRTEQAFTADATFSGALALNAKSLYMLNGESVKKAREAAEKLITLFQQSSDYESLYDSNFILARYYSKHKLDKIASIKHLKEAVRFAKMGKIEWAYIDYDFSKTDFENVQHEPEFKKNISMLKRIGKKLQ